MMFDNFDNEVIIIVVVVVVIIIVITSDASAAVAIPAESKLCAYLQTPLNKAVKL
jgi:hypothetical protein